MIWLWHMWGTSDMIPHAWPLGGSRTGGGECVLPCTWRFAKNIVFSINFELQVALKNLVMVPLFYRSKIPVACLLTNDMNINSDKKLRSGTKTYFHLLRAMAVGFLRKIWTFCVEHLPAWFFSEIPPRYGALSVHCSRNPVQSQKQIFFQYAFILSGSCCSTKPFSPPPLPQLPSRLHLASCVPRQGQKI